ncbi:hypothetical protein Snoj_39520 [Streptomyces nojiriensis]|uniref:Uncharacterized protein n=1 Tax=Streptomyces nojiriensis TaxID=66374 RepID=A0ABQ3SPH4_9ACTN|nr:hypothetical protein GCM10010205_08170 [Streptomyces nojiriensis]GHI70034.1 hypothetical protein Snoj_39520 [Streptomyces nojiriensis]
MRPGGLLLGLRHQEDRLAGRRVRARDPVPPGAVQDDVAAGVLGEQEGVGDGLAVVPVVLQDRGDRSGGQVDHLAGAAEVDGDGGEPAVAGGVQPQGLVVPVPRLRIGRHADAGGGQVRAGARLGVPQQDPPVGREQQQSPLGWSEVQDRTRVRGERDQGSGARDGAGGIDGLRAPDGVDHAPVRGVRTVLTDAAGGDRPAVLGFFAAQGAYPLMLEAVPGVVDGEVDLVGRGPDVLADREAVGGGVVAAGECHGGVSSKWCSGRVAAGSATGRPIPSDGILDSGPVQHAAA